MKVKKANLVKLMVKIATAVVVFFIKNKFFVCTVTMHSFVIPRGKQLTDHNGLFCTKLFPGKNGTYQSLLKFVKLDLKPEPDCERTLRGTRLGDHFKLHRSFLCAGGGEKVDTCKGMSKGGSSVTRKNHKMSIKVAQK